MISQHPFEAGEVRGVRMRALYDLRQLARVADQHDVARRPPHGDHVGETDLSRFVDEQPVEGLLELGPGKEEGRAADDMRGPQCGFVVDVRARMPMRPPDSRPLRRSPCGQLDLQPYVRIVVLKRRKQPIRTLRIASWLLEETATR